MSLTKEQEKRYLRNLVLPEIGNKGQEKLLNSNILVIGAGGLGSSAILYLAAAGVGNIGIVDDDVVELSNLQRQIIHNYQDIGYQKTMSAHKKISLLNEDVTVKTYQLRVSESNLGVLVDEYDLVMDCSDNFSTRFIINEICLKHKKPLVFAAVKGFLGQITIFKSYIKDQPCYACFNPNIIKEGFSLPLSEKGILGSVAGTFGSLQATMAVKEILQIGEFISGKILLADLLRNDIRKVSLRKNPNCRVCS